MTASIAICLTGAMRALPDVVDRLNENLLSVFKDNSDVFVYAPIDQHIASWRPAIDKIRNTREIRMEREDVSNWARAAYRKGGFNEAVPNGFWHTTNLPGNFLGCYDGEGSTWRDNNGNMLTRAGSGLCQLYSTRMCMEMIVASEKRRNNTKYQQVMFTRPDLVWLKPHLPAIFLDPSIFWVMDEDVSVGVVDS